MTTIPKPIKRYICRHAESFPEQNQFVNPSDELKLCIVIPATGERKRIQPVLASLGVGSYRLSQAEVIMVINNARDAPEARVAENLATIKDLREYQGAVPVLVLDRASKDKAYPSSVVGVGAARRSGMDLALWHLLQAGHLEDGAIACLDADSPVAPGYVDALLSVFDAPNPPLAAICQYRHPLPKDRLGARSIVAYELWLRYLELGMHLCGSPYAIQTIGSCMVVSPLGYALSDGMPRRKAGEDFYFLQKVVKVAGGKRILPICKATVYPSPRVSNRVPFGTGHAMHRCIEEGLEHYLYVEPPEAFIELRDFFNSLPDCFHHPEEIPRILSPNMQAFLKSRQGFSTLDRLRANASGPTQFIRSVQTWFGSLQLVRYARTLKRARGGVWIFGALEKVLIEMKMDSILDDLPRCCDGDNRVDSQLEWLSALRNLQEKSCLQAKQRGMNVS